MSDLYADWVSRLKVSACAGQIMIAAADGIQARVSLYVKERDLWRLVFAVDGTIGANGLGKRVEGDRKTPVGVFHFTDAFGILPDPGSVMPYTQVDDSHWWVGDSDSRYYNRFVSTHGTPRDWAECTSEHIVTFGHVYNYILSLDYNKELVPHAGSAIFLHCLRAPGSPTGGCVAIPEPAMIRTLRTVDKTCALIIDTPENIWKY